MTRERPSLAALLAAMVKIGTIGFGGGSALIPVMEEELVNKRKFLTRDQFTTHTIIANLTPGALPVKLAALAATELKRPYAALATACAAALPGTFATVALLAGFSAIGPEGIRIVEFAAVGITAFIIVLLAHFILSVIHSGKTKLAALITLLAFLATGASTFISSLGRLFGQTWSVHLPKLSAVQLILATIALIAISQLFIRDKAPLPATDEDVETSKAPWLATAAFGALALVAFLLSFGWDAGSRFSGLVALSSVTSFGGGEAYVAVADGFFVQNGLVRPEGFYGQAVPIANAMPGPILVKIASALGFSFGMGTGGWPVGVAFAVLAFLISVSASCAPAVALLGGYAKVSKSVFVQRLGIYILPVICGLLVTTSFSMLNASMDIAKHAQLSQPLIGWASLVAVAVLWVLRHHYKIHDLILIFISGAVSIAALLMLAG